MTDSVKEGLTEGLDPVATSAADESSWMVVEDGDLKGFTLIADKDSGDIICLSARHCNDADRRSVMPSMKDYTSLKVIDLHGYRYVKTLHESIGDLPELQRLVLSRCDLLTTLPSSIGNLHSLVEVGLLDDLLSVHWPCDTL
jgi:hypothetical protein